MINIKKVRLIYKIRTFFYIYLWVVKLLSYLNAEKGAIAHDVLIERLHKYPKLFIKEIKTEVI
ncbi:hypothetical protein HED35_03730 [Vagococcus fluvialis]|uniref:Uncharacterized protein n=1 Tax=Vagococcus fluvialis TaxID=2738 RepID=A0A7X6D7I3_9ENTE|nr:hypothetical protein [Vagococcus fluvialis]